MSKATRPIAERAKDAAAHVTELDELLLQVNAVALALKGQTENRTDHLTDMVGATLTLNELAMDKLNEIHRLLLTEGA